MLFIETSEFTKHLRSHLDDDSYAALQVFLSAYPDAGDIIRGSGGIRKIRWRAKGRANGVVAGLSTTGMSPRTIFIYSLYTARA